ncbi:UNVERIFIED_CONTAM: hypothetical protein Sradi_3663900 [Sesamum radiatum]|uniref:CCHC-type domain-containing protein n=1 Tax=Sesamum radiatum TaxID=300843 RepID=A0AAW2QIU8_SESRA
MFILKTTTEEYVLEHIRETKTPTEAWDTFTKLFSKKNDTNSNLLRVKSLYREISELDPEAPIGEARLKRIIVHGLKPEFKSFVVVVQGWPTQPSLVEFKNLLAGQEVLAKKLGGVSLKNDEEALSASKGMRNSNSNGSKRSDDKTRGHQSERSTRTAGGSKNRNNAKKFEGKCYNCGKKGHMARNCWSKKNIAESNIATLKAEDEWDFEASFAADEDELAFAAIISNQINYESDWIVDLGCSNHMTGDKKKVEERVKIHGKSSCCDSRQLKITDSTHNMMKKSMLKELPKLEVRRDTVCAGFQYGKSHQFPYEESNFRVKKPLELNSDVFGPVKQAFIGGMKYMVTFINDFLRYVLVHFMKNKSKTLTKFKEFKKSVETEIGRDVQSYEPTMEENTHQTSSRISFRRPKYACSSHVPALHNRIACLKGKTDTLQKYGEGTTVKENDGGIVTQQPRNVTYLKMLCLMKPPLGGPLARKYYQVPVFLKRS